MSDRLAGAPEFAAIGLVEEFSQRPLSFIDIGARNGVHEVVEPLARLTAVLGFEPDPDECRRLLADPLVADCSIAPRNTSIRSSMLLAWVTARSQSACVLVRSISPKTRPISLAIKAIASENS